MLTLKTITFIYDIREDRILAAVNAKSPDSWSCWLTRRMALAVLAKSDEFVSKTSKLLQNATADTREQLMSFEREAALAKTAGSLTRTPKDVIAGKPRSAELLHGVTLNQRGKTYQIELRGEAGGAAIATVQRDELQTIMQMLLHAAVNGGWVSAQKTSAAEGAVRGVPH